ncbi:MAG TPA: hypothetical protein PLJ21_00090 [Pseudobdellovibrionaceae bacterium]|nr:hypothetical protein [Pseudobdellovibrionaceae bacterium]
MMKKMFLVFAAMGFIINSSCTSSSSSDEGAEDEVTADAGEISEEGDLAEGEEAATEEDGSLAAELSEEGVDADAAATEDPAAAATTAETQPPADGVTPVVPEESAQVQPIEPAPAESSTTEITPPQQTEQPVEIAPAPAPTESPSESYVSEEVAPKPVASLKKVESSAWKSGKFLLNTVYVARPKDTWKKVSEKVFKSQKVSELKKSNPWLSGRELKVGDKVYYNSPNRPTDDSKVITYFEDNNIPSSTYVAQKGDNIRTVSSTLLGFDNAWKEVWATNNVESKGILDEGTELRYWKDDVSAAPPVEQTLAQTAPPPASEVPAANTMPEAPLSEPAATTMETPPSDLAGMQEPPPAPPMEEPPAMQPPPVEEAAAPAPVAAETEGSEGGMAGLLGDDTMTYGALGAIALMALVGIIIRNKRKQKDLEEGFQDTQVG